ncbi:MAG: hypothetical protein IAE91_06785 [Ignavibacteriaceae bacterium]|nr:hypothetical protein [Ignavibacteriaceae bacterium]
MQNAVKIIFYSALILVVIMPQPIKKRYFEFGSYADSIDVSLLQNGDLIFRRGISLISIAVLAVDKESQYSHVGIIFLENEKISVVHSVPEEEPGEGDYVKKESLEVFLKQDRTSNFGVFRVKDSSVANKAAEYSIRLFKEKTPFDNDYNLQDTAKVYCTELIYHAYYKYGIDLSSGEFDEVSFPTGNKKLILPGRIASNKNLQIIIKK